MRIIINAEPEDARDALDLILDSRPMFDRFPERLGWGWHLTTKGGKSYFVRQIKGGLSASPSKARTGAGA